MKIGKIYNVVGVQQQELKYISFQLILDRIESYFKSREVKREGKIVDLG